VRECLSERGTKNTYRTERNDAHHSPLESQLPPTAATLRCARCSPTTPGGNSLGTLAPSREWKGNLLSPLAAPRVIPSRASTLLLASADHSSPRLLLPSTVILRLLTHAHGDHVRFRSETLRGSRELVLRGGKCGAKSKEKAILKLNRYWIEFPNGNRCQKKYMLTLRLSDPC